MTAVSTARRMPLVLPFAGAVTIGLFVMMNGMIDIGPVTPDPVEELPEIVLNFEVPEPPVDDRIDIIEIPDVPPPPPPARPDRPVADNPGPGDAVAYTLPPVAPPEVGNGGTGLVSPDRSPMPVVRIDPVYPATEASRGRSGECTVMFDITPDGSTANIRPVSCTSQAFERATLNAVARWRYNPQVRNGQPIMFRGATTRLVYNLDG